MFSFGKNWKSFLKYVNTETIEKAKNSLIEFTGLKSFQGKRFIDIGCGSGLFSLAAYELKASEVISFDIDKFSVQCTSYLKKKVGNPSNWKIYEGSILDKIFIAKLGKFDLVYAWGVLHHTGNMWEAIKNAASLVEENGLLYIAIYNKMDGWGIWEDGRFGPSSFWKIVKKYFSRLPDIAQNTIVCFTCIMLISLYILTFQNPIKKIKEHQRHRGMIWHIDIKDWLGGYPYEYASPDEVINFCKMLGFTLENLKTYCSLRNNEYLFRKIK